MEQFSDLGIQLKSKYSQQKTTCPNCIRIGKENYKDNCLSVNVDDGVYNCHKCGWSGKLKGTTTITTMEQKSYKAPEKAKLKRITDNGKQFLLDRGITEEVISANKIVSTKDGNSIVFPYLRNGEIVNYKTRGLNDKRFMVLYI
jgi:twinkle protein